MKVGALAIAALAGACMTVQGALNASLGKQVGTVEASFLVHVLASVLLGVGLLVGFGGGTLKAATGAPWYTFLGAPLSVIIIWGVLTSVGRAGVTAANTVIVSTQIVVALILEAFGFGGEAIRLDWPKAVGAVLLGIGSYLLLSGGRR